jgi:hypothetical protein
LLLQMVIGRFINMKLSRPVINIIRFDTDLKVIGNRPGVENRFESTAYCVDGTDEHGKILFAVGIRLRLNFYVDKLENEAAGYLSETESIVINYSTPLEDMDMLKIFVEDVNTNIKHNLQTALPAFDLTVLEFPDPIKFAYYLSEGLIQKGLYN